MKPVRVVPVPDLVAHFDRINRQRSLKDHELDVLEAVLKAERQKRRVCHIHPAQLDQVGFQ